MPVFSKKKLNSTGCFWQIDSKIYVEQQRAKNSQFVSRRGENFCGSE